MQQEDGVLSAVLTRAGVDSNRLQRDLTAQLERQPRQRGGVAQSPGIGPELDRALTAAEQQRQAMKDDYLSVEHFVLGIFEADATLSPLLENCGLSKAKYLEALKEVRGNQRITDQDPEQKYQTLEKYGTDLTARARQGKIDPVIGRDAEIRRVLQILSRRTKNNPVLMVNPAWARPPLQRDLRAAS